MPFQADRGRLRYIQPIACAYPAPVHDRDETASTIRLKSASTIAEMRTWIGAGFKWPWAMRCMRWATTSSGFCVPSLVWAWGRFFCACCARCLDRHGLRMPDDPLTATTGGQPGIGGHPGAAVQWGGIQLRGKAGNEFCRGDYLRTRVCWPERRGGRLQGEVEAASAARRGWQHAPLPPRGAIGPLWGADFIIQIRQ